MNAFLSGLLVLTALTGRAQPDPEKVVQQQLDAYNARDIDRFVATYADSVEIFGFPNRPLMQGKAQLRTSYADLFRRFPENYAALLGRIVQGNTVIDQEKVTGRGGAPTLVTAVYEVQNGLIRRVWFIR